jgi:hypothetical protein
MDQRFINRALRCLTHVPCPYIYLEREIGNAIFYATIVIAAFIFSVDWHGPDEL